MNKNLILLGTLAVLPMASAVAGDVQPVEQPAATNQGDFFTGFSVSDDSIYGYLGANYAFNGDIDSSGWIANGVYGHGEYEYDTTVKIDGTVDQVDLGVGYQWVNDKGRTSVTVGGLFVEHDLSPSDPTNPVEGDDFGLKVKVMMTRSFDHGLNGLVMGDYATSFDSYWSRASLTKDIASFQLGPEIIAMGNEEWDEIRYGLTLGGIQVGPADISISGGYAEASSVGEDQDSFYAALHANFSF